MAVNVEIKKYYKFFKRMQRFNFMHLHGKAKDTYKLVASLLLAACGFLLQLVNGIVGIQTGFGMVVDFVAVPAYIALFAFGLRYSLLTLVFISLFIFFSSPTGFIGALMKFTATLPSLLSLWFVMKILREKNVSYSGLFLAFVLGSLIRGVLMLYLNLYIAAPLFFKISPEEFITKFMEMNLPLFGKGAFLPLVIFFWNAIQNGVELLVSFWIMYKMRIYRFFEEM